MLESSTLCIIPYQDIARLSAEFPGLHDQLLRLMGREFSRQLMFAEGASATQRIARFLLDMRSRLCMAGEVEYELTLPMSREDIANYLGITPETLSRLFTKFQRGGLIDIERRHIFLADPIRVDLIAQGVN